MKGWGAGPKIFVGAIIGAGVGAAMGEKVAPVGELGNVLLSAIKMLAGPLLFLAVVEAFLRAEMSWKQARRFLVFVGINACFAVAIGLSLSNLLRPGRLLQSAVQPEAATQWVGEGVKPLNFTAAIQGLLPKSIVHPFLEGSIPGIIVLAVAFGWALRSVRERRPDLPGVRLIEQGVEASFSVVERLIGAVVQGIPFAVAAVIAKTVGEKGFAPFLGIPAYVGVVVLGLLLQVGVVYQGWLWLVARRPLRAFWRDASEPLVYALGASSSLVTLPITLKTLDRMKVSPGASRLVACVGTNLNNDGILLYEALAVLVVAQAYGIDLSAGQQLLAAGACVLASLGIGGIPDAGLISLSLVLATVGLPGEILPLLLSVDWLLSRARAATNVICDLVGSCVLDSQDRQN